MVGEKVNNSETSGILVIGPMRNTFDRFDAPPKGSFIHKDNMIDGIALAREKYFSKILVVMSGFNGNLSSALRTLRRISRNSKIILIAQMHDEIRARRLASNPLKPDNLADDYLISPVCMSQVMENAPAAQTLQAPVKIENTDHLLEKIISRTEKQPVFKPQQYELISRLEKLVVTDDLTGLKNRRYIFEFLRQAVELAKTESMQVTVLLFDIDNFKQYNDQFGHGVGDNVLKQAAMLIKRCCREHDVVGRIGGDEFAVVFWDKPQNSPGTFDEEDKRSKTSSHPTQALFMAERFRNEISKSDLSSLGVDGKGRLTISGGLATFPRDAQNARELLLKADQAMLEVKHSGKNRISLVG